MCQREYLISRILKLLLVLSKRAYFPRIAVSHKCFSVIPVVFPWCGRTDGRAYGHVITELSRMNGLPNFPRNGALLARSAIIVVIIWQFYTSGCPVLVTKKHRIWASHHNQPLRREVFLMLKNI